MIKGTTSGGFKYELDEKRLDNYELLEALAELEDDALQTSKVIKLILGEKQTDALKEHCRDKNGFVSVQLMMLEIEEIMSEDVLKNL